MDLAENNLALQTYAIGFWKPLPAKSKDASTSGNFYHIQSGKDLVSPLLKKDSSPIKSLIGKMVQKSDFMQLPSEIGDVMTSIFHKEDEILSGAANSSSSSTLPNSKFGELSVNRDLMELHLKSALTLARNARLFPNNRDQVGGFIFKSLAKSGLLVQSEEFLFHKVTTASATVIAFKDDSAFHVH